MTVGIYRLIFPNTDKCYIGQSVNIERRYMQHLRQLEQGTAASKLQSAYNMYGRPQLDIILDNIEVSELDDLEKEAIEIFNSVINGFNTYSDAWQAPSTFKGTEAANAKYTRSQLIEVFNLLVHTQLPYTEIQNQTGVPVGTISMVSNGSQHTWLLEEFPKEYGILLNKKHSRNNQIYVGEKLQARSKGIVYPQILQPSGQIYDVTNAYAFAREHNLAGNHLQEVLNRHRKQHKGWKLYE